MPGLRGVLLDVEGTTTPIGFVTEVLFPYAARHLEDFLARRRADSEVAAALGQLAAEHGEAVVRGEAVPAFGDALPYLRFLMGEDRKSAGLKRLQGLVWREGYESGRLRGQVFADVAPAFAAWRRAGVRLRIFSSGSVLAQRLLFASTPEGDLTAFLDGFHDLSTGRKQDPDSYRAIAGAFGLAPERVLFVSDSPSELDAAAAAGLATRLAERPGNAVIGASGASGASGATDHARIRSFAEI